MGVFQGQGNCVLLFCERELALATGYTASVDVTNILSAVAGGGHQTKRRKCDDHDGGPGTSCTPLSEGCEAEHFQGIGHAVSAWSTSATGRRAPMRVGMAVSTPMTSSVMTTIATSHSAEGRVVVPPPLLAPS